MWADLGFLRQIEASPLPFWLGLLVWIPVAVWIVGTVRWMVMGDVDIGFGSASIALGLGLGYMTMHPPEQYLSPVFFVLVIGTLFLFPVLQRASLQRELARIDLESIENLYENLAHRPDNSSAKFRLAELLWERGVHGHALALGEALLPSLNPNIFKIEFREVTGWRHRMGQHYHPKPIRCLDCGTMNKPGGYLCTKCSGPYLLVYARTMWLGPSIGRRILGAWILGLVVIVGIPVTSSLAVPLPMKVLLVVAEMALGLTVLIGSFRDTARS